MSIHYFQLQFIFPSDHVINRHFLIVKRLGLCYAREWIVFCWGMVWYGFEDSYLIESVI